MTAQTDHSDTRLASTVVVRRASAERVVLVHDYYRNGKSADPVIELSGLAQSAGGIVCAYVRSGRGSPHQKAYISYGKLREVAEAIRRFSATLVIFESQISPIQERNLERELNCRVIDRVRLILDIFALQKIAKVKKRRKN